MSAFNDLDLTCPDCGEEFRGTVWTAIHTKEDPELKDLMLGGELNIVMCERCMQVSFYDNFLIYHDPSEELLAYVYPESQVETRADMESLAKSGFAESQKSSEPKQRLKYEPVVIFGLANLVEAQREEIIQTEQSDVAEEVCKEKGIPHIKIRPSVARHMKLPRALPGVASGIPSREQVIKGLERLLEVAPALDRYQTLLETIKAEKGWEF